MRFASKQADATRRKMEMPSACFAHYARSLAARVQSMWNRQLCNLSASRRHFKRSCDQLLNSRLVRATMRRLQRSTVGMPRKIISKLTYVPAAQSATTISSCCYNATSTDKRNCLLGGCNHYSVLASLTALAA